MEVKYDLKIIVCVCVCVCAQLLSLTLIAYFSFIRFVLSLFTFRLIYVTHTKYYKHNIYILVSQ